MTLAQWAEFWPYKVSKHSTGAMWTPDAVKNWSRDWRVEAFHLSDYLVSSITGGTIWFVPREKGEPQ